MNHEPSSDIVTVKMYGHGIWDSMNANVYDEAHAIRWPAETAETTQILVVIASIISTHKLHLL